MVEPDPSGPPLVRALVSGDVVSVIVRPAYGSVRAEDVAATYITFAPPPGTTVVGVDVVSLVDQRYVLCGSLRIQGESKRDRALASGALRVFCFCFAFFFELQAG